MIALTELDGRPVLLDGKSHEVLVLAGARQARPIERIVAADGQLGRPARPLGRRATASSSPSNGKRR